MGEKALELMRESTQENYEEYRKMGEVEIIEDDKN